MSAAHRIVTSLIKHAIRALCRVHDEQLCKVPEHGPLIMATNHINFLEVPLIYTHLQPRPLIGFAKAETWANPVLGPLAKLWEGIPLHRGEADVAAFRHGLEALRSGRILAVAPEGTRSGDGRLQEGQAGIVLLALRSGAPILPVAHYGGEKFWPNLRRLRRTDVHIVVGTPYRIDLRGTPITHAVRRALADDAMRRIAALLPPAYHGVYASSPPPSSPYVQLLEA